jgi:hypothetical protein
MNAVLLLLVLSASPHMQVFNESATTTRLKVTFPEDMYTEHTSVTRFILSPHTPDFSYTIDERRTPDRTMHAVLSSSPVKIGTPFPFHGQTLYPVKINARYRSGADVYSCNEINIVFHHPSAPTLDLTPAMQQVFKNLILNFPEMGDMTPQGYLIITYDAFYDSIMPLARWKEKKGWSVEVRTLSQTGSSPTEIKDYIANAYQTWSPRPEYVLLVGDVNQIPAHSVMLPVGYTDYSYALVGSNDFLAELLIGRLPANNVNELNTMVAKILGYEQTPYMDETAWFERALMVAANYPLDTMTTPIPVKRWVRDRFLDNGYDAVDTVFYPPVTGASEITAAVNQGVSFINYRGGIADPDGWVLPNFHNTDVIALTNGWMLPVITSLTCWNGNFGHFTCFGEAWVRSGSPIAPKGGVAFFGASATQTSSRWNNCLDYGIYWGLLEENIYNIAPVMYRGKMEVYMNFPLDTTWESGSSFYFHTYNLLGDPSLDMWTGIPDTFRVTYDNTLAVGTNFVDVQVLNSASQPVDDALVSLYKDGEVKEIAYTNGSGYADFEFLAATPGSLFVTVTKHNFKPHLGYAMMNNSAVYVGYNTHTIDDAAGNNNGEVNPGETIDMQVTLKNYGTSTTATNISAKLTSDDALIVITDSLKTYSNIAPGGTATASPYTFQVSTNARHDHTLKFDLEITTTQGTWYSTVWIPVRAPDFEYVRKQIDGNGVIEPGETSSMTVTITNQGGLTGTNVNGILWSNNTSIIITDSTGTYGTVGINDTVTNTSNQFTISAPSSISPGHPIRMFLRITGDSGVNQNVYFEITVGVVNQTKPLGPDDYGYFAYDDTDAGYPEHPSYDWVEIDPELGGPGDSISLGNDEAKTISLPFDFTYYGDTYNKISVCSNGYIAMDSSWVADMYNWHIPAAGGPPLLIAPFWDDLDPTATDSSGHACFWHDAANHRFIIEYSRVQHIHDPTNPVPSELQTFQVILFDPGYYPTVTGDGEILFQYRDIQNDDEWHNYATVGIENADHTVGLEYTYANIYPAAAAPLADNRAIKFTTDPPDTFPGVEEFAGVHGNENPFHIFPNPTRGKVTMRCMSSVSNVHAKIYDAAGRLIRQWDYTHMSPSDRITWDGTDVSGSRISQGVYFVSITSTDKTLLRKIVLLTD